MNEMNEKLEVKFECSCLRGIFVCIIYVCLFQALYKTQLKDLKEESEVTSKLYSELEIHHKTMEQQL